MCHCCYLSLQYSIPWIIVQEHPQVVVGVVYQLGKNLSRVLLHYFSHWPVTWCIRGESKIHFLFSLKFFGNGIAVVATTYAFISLGGWFDEQDLIHHVELIVFRWDCITWRGYPIPSVFNMSESYPVSQEYLAFITVDGEFLRNGIDCCLNSLDSSVHDLELA